ncbi:uncharacterized protein [Linepithema humile]|uniref:uncharacterized protein n=1 Tax=Linepithema humile TaxID=83485 RepID=UPI00351E542F
MKTIRALKMPKNKAEMMELRKNFTHQATLYRSYYKHWKETADQAVKEIAGRTVMATAKFRGTGDSESAMDVAASQSAQYSMRQAESAVVHSTEGTTTATTTTTMQPAAPLAPAAQESAKREGAKQLVADVIRADEDIPYFFYLRVEPDVDIAIQCNDERAISPDSDRERISANRKYLYFNLTDEPEAEQLGL